MSEFPFDPTQAVPYADDQFGATTPEPADLAAALPENPAGSVDYTVPQMSADKLERLGQTLAREIEEYQLSTALRRSNTEEWRRDYELVQGSQNGPWDNSSALRAPNVREVCQQHSMRLDGILDADPPFQAVARTEAAVGKTEQIEDALQSKLEQAKFRVAARDMHVLLPIDGNALMLVEWEERQVRAPMLEVEQDRERMSSDLQIGIAPEDAWTENTEQGADGKIKLYLNFRNKTTYDGLRLVPVKWQDALYLPASARDPGDCWALGEIKTVRGLELKRGAKTKKYLKSPVEQLLARPSDQERIDRGQTLVDEGIDPTPSVYGGSNDDPLYRVYEIAELYYYADLDDDGEMEWYVVAVHLDTRTVVRCQYSPYWHGKSAYVPFRYMRRPRELFGCGLPELLALLQDAASASWNNFFDLIDMMVGAQGSFLYDDTAEINPSSWKISPGQPQKVGSLTGIIPNPIPAGIPATLEALLKALDLLKNHTDLLTASSNPTLGAETDSQKTLGEVQLVFGQAMQIFGNLGEGVALDWAEVLDRCRWLLAQFGAQGGEVEYRQRQSSGVTFERIDIQTLLEDVDIEPAGLHQFADQQTQFTIATLVLQQFAANPLTMGNPLVMLDALDNWLQKARYPNRDSVMGMLRQQVQQQMLLQQAQAEIAAQQLAMLPPGTESDNPESGNPGSGGPPQTPPNLAPPMSMPGALPPTLPGGPPGPAPAPGAM